MSTGGRGDWRLDHLLSRCGYCSRREARQWLRAGRVLVKGARADDPGQRVDAAQVRVDGAAVEHPDGLLAVLHKPAGYACSHDPSEAPTVYDLLPERWLRRNPGVTTVGRLDRDTTGVLLLTDQGELVQRWTSPRHTVIKRYEVTVNRDLDPRLIGLFAAGTLQLAGDEAPCRPARLELLAAREAALELVEGRFHQVKRMFADAGYLVVRLHRSRFGRFTVEDLAAGQWRLAELVEDR